MHTRTYTLPNARTTYAADSPINAFTPNPHQGATPAASLAELAAQVDVLVTMLPATQHVTAVMEGAVLPNAK